MSRNVPGLRALSILALSRCPALAESPWHLLQNLPGLVQLTLQESSQADLAGLVATLGPQLEKVSVTEMIGERNGRALCLPEARQR